MQVMGSLRVMGAALLWTSAGWAAEICPSGLPPLALAEARLLVGGGALLLWVGPRRAWTALRALPPGSLAGAALAMAIFQWGFFVAVDTLGSAAAVLLTTAVGPVAATALDIRRSREGAGRRWWISAALLVAAIGTLRGPGPATGLGSLAAVASGVAYALFARTTARMDKAVGTIPGGLLTTAVALTGAGLLLAPVAMQAPLPTPTLPSLAVVLYLGLVATALGYALFARGLRDVPTDRALALLVVQPLAALAGNLLLDRHGPAGLGPLPALLIGCALLARWAPWPLSLHRRHGPGAAPRDGSRKQCP